MPFTYDIKTDDLYLEGREEGALQKSIEAIQRVLLRLPDYSDTDIADLLGVDVELVQRVRHGDISND